MQFIALIFLLLAVLRGVIMQANGLNFFLETHLMLLIPDLAFAATLIFWLFRLRNNTAAATEKRKPPSYLALGLWSLAFVGSYLWDYQPGYYAVKFFVMPGLLVLLLNPSALTKPSFSTIIRSLFPVFVQPFLSLKTMLERIVSGNGRKEEKNQKAEAEDEFTFPIGPVVATGVIVGMGVLLVLMGLDEDFGSFLRQVNIWDIITSSFWALVSMLASFFWYVWHPTFVKVEEKQDSAVPLKRYLQIALIVGIGVCIAYSVYDSYIALRVFKLVKLAFETIGKNTQLYFVELVALGGSILFIASTLLNGILVQDADKKKRARMYIILLSIVVLLLIPPLLNLFRVLLTIYIPQFGMSARRLFGIYTGISFLAATSVFLWQVLKEKMPPLQPVVATFFLALVALCFILPSNIIIMDSHIRQYLKGEPADFTYFSQLNAGKTAPFFRGILNNRSNTAPTDLYWRYILALRSGDTQETKSIMQELRTGVKKDLQELDQFARNWDYSGMVTEFGTRKYKLLGYKDGVIPGVSITTNSQPALLRVEEIQKDSNELNTITFSSLEVLYTKEQLVPQNIVAPSGTASAPQTTIYTRSGTWFINLGYNTSRRGTNLVTVINANPSTVLCQVMEKNNTCTEESLQRKRVEASLNEYSITPEQR